MELSIFGLKIIIYLPYKSLGMLFFLIGLTIASYILMVRLRRKRVARFGNFRTLKKVHGYRMLIPHPALLITKIIVITLLFLVATESIQINMMRPVANTDFVIAIDASQTMLMPDYTPNRLEKAKEVAIKWLDYLPDTTKIGIIKFSDKAVPVTPLTNNFGEIRNGIMNIKVDLNSSGTAIGDALLLGSSMLAHSQKQKMLILITDGKNNVGENITKAIDELKKNGVIVYTIGVGNNELTEEFFKQLEDIIKQSKYISGYVGNTTIQYPELDMDALKEISKETGGKAFEVTNETVFNEALKQIIIRNERIPLNSDYYILIFISILLITELLVFAKFGAI